MSVRVNVDNFVEAETARMFTDLQRDAGGVNRFSHNREPASVDHQTVIRLNRDTLYSFAVVDVSDGASVVLPPHGERYVSAMVVNEQHHVTAIFHEEGKHEFGIEQSETRHVVVALRILVDASKDEDVAEAAALQDQFVLTAASDRPFQAPTFDTATLDETRGALLTLASGLDSFDRMFGGRADVDPIRHLLGTAAGWGGLPSEEATYVGVEPKLPAGQYELVVRDVPVDGFWSISVYNRAGYFEPNELGVYSVNSVTGARNDDGSITVRFGDHGPGVENAIPLPQGWNYLVRLYRPRREVLDGSWRFPTLEPR